MQLTALDIRFTLAPNPVRENVFLCTECPAVSQVGRTGELLDIPGPVFMDDLRWPRVDTTSAWPSPQSHPARRDS